MKNPYDDSEKGTGALKWHTQKKHDKTDPGDSCNTFKDLSSHTKCCMRNRLRFNTLFAKNLRCSSYSKSNVAPMMSKASDHMTHGSQWFLHHWDQNVCKAIIWLKKKKWYIQKHTYTNN